MNVRASAGSLPRIIALCVWTLVALVVLKFVVLLADNDWDPAKAPWALLVLVIVPAVGIAVLLGRRPRAGALVAGLLLLLFAATIVAALARDGLARQAWADYPFAYGGLVASVVGIVCAVRLWRAPAER